MNHKKLLIGIFVMCGVLSGCAKEDNMTIEEVSTGQPSMFQDVEESELTFAENPSSNGTYSTVGSLKLRKVSVKTKEEREASTSSSNQAVVTETSKDVTSSETEEKRDNSGINSISLEDAIGSNIEGDYKDNPDLNGSVTKLAVTQTIDNVFHELFGMGIELWEAENLKELSSNTGINVLGTPSYGNMTGFKYSGDTAIVRCDFDEGSAFLISSSNEKFEYKGLTKSELAISREISGQPIKVSEDATTYFSYFERDDVKYLVAVYTSEPSCNINVLTDAIEHL